MRLLQNFRALSLSKTKQFKKIESRKIFFFGMSAQRSSIAVGVRDVSLTRQKTQLLAQCWRKLLQFWLNVACCTKVSSLAQIVQKSQSVLAYVLPTSDPNCGQVPRSIRLSFRGCAPSHTPLFQLLKSPLPVSYP